MNRLCFSQSSVPTFILLTLSCWVIDALTSDHFHSLKIRSNIYFKTPISSDSKLLHSHSWTGFWFKGPELEKRWSLLFFLPLWLMSSSFSKPVFLTTSPPMFSNLRPPPFLKPKSSWKEIRDRHLQLYWGCDYNCPLVVVSTSLGHTDSPCTPQCVGGIWMVTFLWRLICEFSLDSIICWHRRFDSNITSSASHILLQKSASLGSVPANEFKLNYFPWCLLDS